MSLAPEDEDEFRRAWGIPDEDERGPLDEDADPACDVCKDAPATIRGVCAPCMSELEAVEADRRIDEAKDERAMARMEGR